MITLLRKIRKKLITKGNFSSYLLYAIGEIVLVVLGILIALQINTWNQQRNNQDLAKAYLIGILEDLQRDTTYLHLAQQSKNQQLKLYEQMDLIQNKVKEFEIVEPIHKDLVIRNPFLDKEKFKLFSPGLAFYPSSATFNSMVADGKLDLIKNLKLRKDIQNLYNVRYEQIVKNGDRYFNMATEIQQERRLVLNSHSMQDIVNDAFILADIEFLKIWLKAYINILNRAEKGIAKLQEDIENEIQQLENH